MIFSVISCCYHSLMAEDPDHLIEEGIGRLEEKYGKRLYRNLAQLNLQSG